MEAFENYFAADNYGTPSVAVWCLIPDGIDPPSGGLSPYSIMDIVDHYLEDWDFYQDSAVNPDGTVWAARMFGMLNGLKRSVNILSYAALWGLCLPASPADVDASYTPEDIAGLEARVEALEAQELPAMPTLDSLTDEADAQTIEYIERFADILFTVLDHAQG